MRSETSANGAERTSPLAEADSRKSASKRHSRVKIDRLKAAVGDELQCAISCTWRTTANGQLVGYLLIALENVSIDNRAEGYDNRYL